MPKRTFAVVAAVMSITSQLASHASDLQTIVCTLKSPDVETAIDVTFEFSETGYVNFRGKRYEAQVDRNELRFCYPMTDSKPSCWRISRVTGNYTATAQGAGAFQGVCVTAATRKF
jgi:hypothetical protein